MNKNTQTQTEKEQKITYHFEMFGCCFQENRQDQEEFEEEKMEQRRALFRGLQEEVAQLIIQ